MVLLIHEVSEAFQSNRNPNWVFDWTKGSNNNKMCSSGNNCYYFLQWQRKARQRVLPTKHPFSQPNKSQSIQRQRGTLIRMVNLVEVNRLGFVIKCWEASQRGERKRNSQGLTIINIELLSPFRGNQCEFYLQRRSFIPSSGCWINSLSVPTLFLTERINTFRCKFKDQFMSLSLPRPLKRSLRRSQFPSSVGNLNTQLVYTFHIRIIILINPPFGSCPQEMLWCMSRICNCTTFASL